MHIKMLGKEQLNYSNFMLTYTPQIEKFDVQLKQQISKYFKCKTVHKLKIPEETNKIRYSGDAQRIAAFLISLKKTQAT